MSLDMYELIEMGYARRWTYTFEAHQKHEAECRTCGKHSRSRLHSDFVDIEGTTGDPTKDRLVTIPKDHEYEPNHDFRFEANNRVWFEVCVTMEDADYEEPGLYLYEGDWTVKLVLFEKFEICVGKDQHSIGPPPRKPHKGFKKLWRGFRYGNYLVTWDKW